MPIKDNLEFIPLNIALATISDTRTMDTDSSGAILADRITGAGHILAQRAIIKDDEQAIVAQLRAWMADDNVQIIITTGGTGLTVRDVTPEALEQVADKHIPGFGELFRWLSYKNIGTSTIQSRACAVLAGGTYIFALPGSNGAVKDGWDEILQYQLDSRFKPCNFVDLLPRIK